MPASAVGPLLLHYLTLRRARVLDQHRAVIGLERRYFVTNILAQLYETRSSAANAHGAHVGWRRYCAKLRVDHADSGLGIDVYRRVGIKQFRLANQRRSSLSLFLSWCACNISHYRAPNMYEVVNTRTVHETIGSQGRRTVPAPLFVCSPVPPLISAARCAHMQQASPFVCQHYVTRLQRACPRLHKPVTAQAIG